MVDGRFCDMVKLETMMKSLLSSETALENFTITIEQPAKFLKNSNETNDTPNQSSNPSVFSKQPMQDLNADDKLIAQVASGKASLVIQPTMDATIKVYRANITTLPVSAIVNSANSMLQV